jgi:hypothetical protein
LEYLIRLGTRNDVAMQKEFIDDLKNAATKANQEVLFSKIANQVGRFDNPWLIFSKYIDPVNEKCTQLVLPKWENKLGGARKFMLTHCFTMSEADRVDPTFVPILSELLFEWTAALKLALVFENSIISSVPTSHVARVTKIRF